MKKRTGERRSWQVVINFAAAADNDPDVLQEAVQKEIRNRLETMTPAPEGYRFARRKEGPAVASILFGGILAPSGRDAQILADNLMRRCTSTLEDLSLKLDSCGLREKNPSENRSGNEGRQSS